MTGSDDWELTELRKVDPALRDAPPAPGSVRYDTILERAMSLQTATTNTNASTNAPMQRPPRSRRWMGWAAAGTGVAASVLATVVVLGGDSTSASAAVLAAAERTEKVVSLRGTTQTQDNTGKTTTTTMEANGADMKIVTKDTIGTVTTTILGDIGYESTSDGQPPRTSPMSADERLAPFADAAANVVQAALDGGEVTDKGTEQVRGADARHYQVTLTAQSRKALAALPATQTAWFEVEDAQKITSIDIWTAGDLIRRIAVAQPELRTTSEFYDFGQPVTVTKPAGF